MLVELYKNERVEVEVVEGVEVYMEKVEEVV